MGLYNDVKQLPGFSWFENCISPKDVVFIGLRDLDVAEKLFIKDLGIRTYTVS